MEDIATVQNIIAHPKDTVILSHRNPDGDAVGSSLGLKHYLEKHGHVVQVILPSDYPDFLAWMPAVADTIIYDDEPERAIAEIERAELIFCLDFNSLDRVDKMADSVTNNRAPKIMIDHHLFPEPFADYIFSDTAASSTSEMVVDFIRLLDDEDNLDAEIGECLFAGILTDTGSFKYSTSPKLFRTVADLIELGVNDYKLQDLIFNSVTEKQLRLLGHCLSNRMEILPEFCTGIITLTKEDYTEFDIKRGDTEGVVNFLLKMPQVKMAAFIHEQPTIVKLSLRSKGDIDVQEIAKKHFRGGGHKNAAGGASFQGLRGTVRKFKELLPEYQTMLTANV